ncbi:MAG: hypothetical protein FWH27_10495 [Planctomycetaceae bacterium]|nr:hypothetical protein [Planctomycetaceae bacterium]
MKTGDAFLAPDKDHHNIKHLYIIVSDPSQNSDAVFLVMVSTHETYKDETCILESGDHPRINHRSVVIYVRPPAVLTSVSRLKSLVESGMVEIQQPVSETVLSKNTEGCTKTRHIESGIETLLFKQGLLRN